MSTYERSEQVLSALLEKLPRPAAPRALRDRIAAMVDRPARPSRPVVVLATLLAAVFAVAVGIHGIQSRWNRELLYGEAVNDHLRILESAPLSQVKGGLHEVKPWFGGKLDFAPSVAFAGDDDYVLEGGTVEHFLDRRAAVFGYRRRLHAISLLVTRSEGLRFPATPRLSTVRGFTVVLWEDRGQGFALVSDLNAKEMLELERRIGPR